MRYPPSLLVLWQQGRARNPLFFGGNLHRFLEDLDLKRLLAKDALKLVDLGTRCGQLGGRNHALSDRHGDQGAFALQLALLE